MPINSHWVGALTVFTATAATAEPSHLALDDLHDSASVPLDQAPPPFPRAAALQGAAWNAGVTSHQEV